MRFVFVRCIATFFVCDETDAVGPWSCYRTSGADGVVLFGSTVFMENGQVVTQRADETLFLA
jgi:hypothetical protein